jgi:hypothetical protein
MFMRKFTKSVVALAIAAMPLTMSAQTPTTFTLPSSFVGFGGVASGGFMATATIGGLTGMWSVFCIDDNHGIALVPTPIEVFATEVLSTSNFSKTRLNTIGGQGLGLTSAESFARYSRAKEFAAAINMANGDNAFNRTQQVAMWDVTDNGVNPTSAAQSAASINTAPYRAFVLSGRTGTAQNLMQQELIAIQPGVPVVVAPEPSTYAMLATGLVMFGVVARRRRQA